jgi:anaerobic selenocysteine-containing dehydrogenase
MPRTQSLSMPERYTQEMVDKLVGPEFPIPFQPFFEGTTSAYYRVLDSVLTGKPYPVRTIIAPGTQPAVSTRGTKRVLEALKKVDFYVVVDVMRTADMDYADIVLPTTTTYEADHPFEARADWAMARTRVIEPLGDFKSIFDFFLELAVRMGYSGDFWDGDTEAMQNFQLSNFGMTLGELRGYPTGKTYESPAGGRTYENYTRAFSARSLRFGRTPFLPDGKVALYNTAFEQEGFSPLPDWHEMPESPTGTPELLGEYPLLLSDYHTSRNFSAAWQRNVPLLRGTEPYPLLHIQPQRRGARDQRRRLGCACALRTGTARSGFADSRHPPDTVMLLQRLVAGLPRARPSGPAAHGRRGQRQQYCTTSIPTERTIR